MSNRRILEIWVMAMFTGIAVAIAAALGNFHGEKMAAELNALQTEMSQR